MYLSSTNTIFAEKVKESSSQQKIDSDVQKLAAATFEAFFPFINIRDCGKKIPDTNGEPTPIHLITQEAFKFADAYWRRPVEDRKHFKPVFDVGSRRGRPFHYWAHFLNRVMSSQKIAEQIQGKEVYYYTSAKSKFALPYLDIDAHNGEQDELEARRLMKNICGGLWNPSSRGQNGYFKLHYGAVHTPVLSERIADELTQQQKHALRQRIAAGLTPQEVNAMFGRAEQLYRRYLEFHNIACTFEIKGNVSEYTKQPLDGTLQIKSGSLAKFPFKNWSWDRLTEFKDLKTIEWHVWEWHLNQLEKLLDVKAGRRRVTGAAACGGTQSPEATDVYEMPSARELPPHTNKTAGTVGLESCAFSRNHRDCKPFVREFYRQNGRTPTHRDFLTHLKVSGLFTGEWEDPKSDRFCRTARVLEFSLQTFDPDKVGTGRWGKLPTPNWLKKYAQTHFGAIKAEVSKDTDKYVETESGLESCRRTQKCKVPAKFVRYCAWVILSCIEDIAENNGLPENRIVNAWGLLPNAPAWNRDYYAIVRSHLEKRGIINIYDKEHRVNKCWRWEKGSSYPLSPEKIERKVKAIRISRNWDRKEQSNTHKPSSKITPYYKKVDFEVSEKLIGSTFDRPPP